MKMSHLQIALLCIGGKLVLRKWVRVQLPCEPAQRQPGCKPIWCWCSRDGVMDRNTVQLIERRATAERLTQGSDLFFCCMDGSRRKICLGKIKGEIEQNRRERDVVWIRYTWIWRIQTQPFNHTHVPKPAVTDMSQWCYFILFSFNLCESQVYSIPLRLLKPREVGVRVLLRGIMQPDFDVKCVVSEDPISLM